MSQIIAFYTWMILSYAGAVYLVFKNPSNKDITWNEIKFFLFGAFVAGVPGFLIAFGGK